MREAKAYQFIKRLLGDGVAITRLETSTESGVPDLVVGRNGKECWVELKISKSNSLNVMLRPAQFAWIKRNWGLGRRIRIIVACEEGGVVWLHVCYPPIHERYVGPAFSCYATTLIETRDRDYARERLLQVLFE